MHPLFAELDPQTTSSALIVGMAVLGLSSVASLGVSVVMLFRMGNGKDSERQIEPTDLHAIKSELGTQTKTLGDIKVDVGVVKAKVDIVEKNVDGVHIRLGGISRELASTTTRVDGLEKREG